MKTTKEQLNQIIKEEIQNVILEQMLGMGNPEKEKLPPERKKQGPISRAMGKTLSSAAILRARHQAIKKINILTKQAMAAFKKGRVANNSALEMLHSIAYGKDEFDPADEFGDDGPRP